ncbi:hypothetical protein [Streptomyces sp. DSM 41921]|uniref:Secreted protein n=1 Tax=Streptomyces dubilierae TaxID=3075533 RepID=A0ABU2PGM0_9ACTN|nr:hypothetical protein [Streptomyces sp. DSM 41921]MDT0391302.1 hypothetical protein [Streptomyces sp. DSM 41921]
MAAMTFLPLPAPSKPVADDPSADLDGPRHHDPQYCVFSSESACTEPPLTSEPPLPDAEPLTSEPPLAEAAPLTSEPPAFVPDHSRL